MMVILQLENGVGMLRLLDTEVRLAVEKRTGDEKPRSITVATGKLAAPYIEKCLEKISTKYPNLEYEVITIRTILRRKDHSFRAYHRHRPERTAFEPQAG